MNKRILILICLTFSMLGFTQEEKIEGVFKKDTLWLEEIITFPFGFAPEIKYEGYEDLRFSKSWRDSKSEEFWSYMFTWHVKGKVNLSAESLKKNIELYYNGLMQAVNKKKDFEVPKTEALFVKNSSKNEDFDFSGHLKTYDSFTTEAMVRFNVKVKYFYCKNTNTSEIVFRVSPQSFDHNIWSKFNTVEFKDDWCD